jgi:hypothetical protein
MKSKYNKVRIGTKTNTRDPTSMKGREWDYSNDDRLERNRGAECERLRKETQIARVTN